jgi:hypothetical protein
VSGSEWAGRGMVIGEMRKEREITAIIFGFRRGFLEGG